MISLNDPTLPDPRQSAPSPRPGDAGAPRISVIVPTYDRGHCVAEAIDSILAQIPPAHQIVVIDDGSTDDTQAVLARYGDRIEVIAQANAGPAAARNAGLARATGDWIAFLDSDDLWRPGRLARLAADLARDDARDAVLHVADLRMTGAGYDRGLFELRGLDIPQGETRSLPPARAFALAMAGLFLSSAAVRVDAARAAGGFPHGMAVSEDAYFFCIVALTGAALFAAEPLAEVRRMDGDAVAAVDLFRTDPLAAYGFRQRRFDMLLDHPMPPPMRDLVRRRASGNLLHLAQLRAAAGAPGRVKDLVRSARLHPAPLRGWLKALPPLVLGQRGFGLVLGSQDAFSRARSE